MKKILGTTLLEDRDGCRDMVAVDEFHRHEAFHMAMMFGEMIDSQMADNAYIRLHPEHGAVIEKITDALNTLYQAIASEHLGEDA
jgi:hypothetical protein